MRLDRLVQKLPARQWLAAPAKNDELARGNVLACYSALQAKGINPFMTPVVIDVGCSPKFRHFRVDASPCITKQRGAAAAYWCSTKGGRLTITELGRLQGFEDHEVWWRDVGLSEQQFGGMLGNAQSLCVVDALLPHVLYAAKLIDADDLRLLAAARTPARAASSA